MKTIKLKRVFVYVYRKNRTKLLVFTLNFVSRDLAG